MNSKLKKKKKKTFHSIFSHDIQKMDDQCINKLHKSFALLLFFLNFNLGILKLRSERDEITSQLLKEKKAYSDYEMMIKKKSLELEKFLSKLKEKENKINDYDSIIRQAEQTYQRVQIIFTFPIV